MGMTGEIENAIEQLESIVADSNNKSVIVKVITEVDYITATWVQEEIERVINTHGIKKAYEIFKSI
jgi:anti-anti-sigma regulatory factor